MMTLRHSRRDAWSGQVLTLRLIVVTCVFLGGTACGQPNATARSRDAGEPAATTAPEAQTTAPAEQETSAPAASPPPLTMPSRGTASTPAERKVDSNLLAAIKRRQSGNPDDSGLGSGVVVGADGTVDIVITAQVDDAYLARLKTLGLDISDASSEHSQIRARAPIDAILAVAALPETVFVSAWLAPMTNPQGQGGGN